MLLIIFAGLFTIFSFIVYRQYQDMQRLYQWTLYNYEVIRQSRLILMDLVNMETGVRGFLLSGDEKFLEPFEDSYSNLEDQLLNLHTLTHADSQIQRDLEIWLEKIEFFIESLNAQVELERSEGRGDLSHNALMQQKAQMDELRALLEVYIKSTLQRLNQQVELSKERQDNFKYIIITGTLLSIGGMIAATLFITSLIKRNLQSQQEIDGVESRFLTVMSGTNDGLYDFNLKEGSAFFSKSFKAMLGFEEEDFPNKIEAFNLLLHPEDYKATWEALRKYQEGEMQSFSITYRMRHKDGHWLWILSRGVGLKNPDGKLTRIIGTHTDMTEHKKREQMLEQLKNEMETFTYITSHDLRAPLVNLKGFTRELQHALDKSIPLIRRVQVALSRSEQDALKQALDEDIPESLRFIISSVEKMDALTTAVLDLSRIGKYDHQLEVLDPSVIVKRCLDTLTYEINRKNAVIVCEDLPEVYSDKRVLEQVFCNILDNAVKYLDPARPGKISISARASESDVVFAIKDNGRGIEEVDKIKVFQFFRRARNTADVSGMGMGMTFVQAALRRLGGEIWFDSTSGIGTTFYFRLPHHPERIHAV